MCESVGTQTLGERDPEEFLQVRAGVERVASGDPVNSVAEDVGMAESSLRYLSDERAALYLGAEAADDRVAEAVEEITPLPDTDSDELEAPVREIVCDELDEE